jgi:hypothetical protein
MSEGIVHLSPPFVSTDEDLEFVANAVESLLDRMEKIIPERLS